MSSLLILNYNSKNNSKTYNKAYLVTINNRIICQVLVAIMEVFIMGIDKTCRRNLSNKYPNLVK